MSDEGPSRDELKGFHEGLFGKPGKQSVHFITQPWLDVEESLRKKALTGDHEGSRTVIPRVYMATISAGVKHSKFYRLASDKDIAAHPAEFAAYQEEIRRGNQENFQRWPVDGRVPHQPQPNHLQGISGPGDRIRHPIGAAFARGEFRTDPVRVPIGEAFARRAG